MNTFFYQLGDLHRIIYGLPHHNPLAHTYPTLLTKTHHGDSLGTAYTLFIIFSENI